MKRTKLARTALGAFFILAGTMHFIVPGSYEAIVPSWLPAPAALVAISGIAEIAGGVGLLLPRWRRLAGIGLVALLVAVFPANVEMLRQARADTVALWYEIALWLRLPLQGALLWWVWKYSAPFPKPPKHRV